MKNIKLFKKTDLILIFALLIAALLCFIPNLTSKSGNVTAVITADGKIIKEINLNTAENMTVEINNTVIEVENGEIFFSQSSCKDKICIKSGKISKKGEASACVPNGVSVYIKGNENDIDAIVY